MLKLSSRLQTVFDNLLPGKPVWDVCCDHGQLGIEAYRSGKFSEVHFVDPVPTIIARLEDLFSKHALPEAATPVNFHCQAGENLHLPVTGTVAATGVGAFTLIDIFKGLSERNLLHADRLILGPHKDEGLVTEFFLQDSLQASYKSVLTLFIEERGRQRKLLIYDRIF